MVDPLSIAGSIASIAAFGATFTQWWQGRRSHKKKATLQHYIDWLRRRERADLVEQIKSAQDTSNALSNLIEELKTASKDHTAELLARFDRQDERLTAIDDKLDDLPEVLERRLATHIQEAIARLPAPSTPSREDEEYEESYRKALAISLDEVELFGVELPVEASQQKLSAAYISLSLGSVGGAESSGPRPAEQVFDGLTPKTGKLLIRGDAGSGKSTLMRWVAIKAAQRDDGFEGDLSGGFEESTGVPLRYARHVMHAVEPFHLGQQGRSWTFQGDELRRLVQRTVWTRRVPFLIAVRSCKKGKFPPIDDYPLQCGAQIGKPPTGWMQRILEAGRGLVLIDGIDEVPPKNRAEIRRQIKSLSETYPHNYFILTTRPAAVEQEWLADLGFREALVAPLTGDERDSFVDKWHEAVQIELDKRDRHEDLRPLADKLKNELRDNPGVGILATTPLLAAMICALHRDRRQKLPEAQYELVEALCHMLVFRRERESGLDVSEFPAEYRDLSDPQRRAILQRLAHYLVTQELSELEEELATKKIADALETIPGRRASDAPTVLKGFIERSGMLRRKTQDSVDFIHNTFKEYLAARQFVQDVDVKRLFDNAKNAEWDNILLFAAATPESGTYATDLIKKVAPPVQKKNGRPQPRKSKAERLALYRRKMMAVRMRAVAQQLDSKLDQRVKAMEKDVFPPRTLTDAAALAQTGAGVERYLRYDPKNGVARRVACVRALRLMDTDAAKSALRGYVDDDKWPVIEELSQALNPLEITEVVRRLQLDWNHKRYDEEKSVRGRIDDLTPLAGHTALQNLDLSDTQVTDLTPLAGLTALQELHLPRTKVTDLTPLAGLTALQSLYLLGTGVTDLTLLAGMTALQRVYLDDSQVTDLTPLAGLTALQYLSFDDTQVIDLTPLARLTALQNLELRNTQVTDLTPLAALTALRNLDLRNTQVSDLTPLAGLTALRNLDLRNTQVSDVTPLAGMTALQELYLFATQVTDVTPLAGLTALQYLYLNDTQVTDVTPLAHMKGLVIIGP